MASSTGSGPSSTQIVCDYSDYGGRGGKLWAAKGMEEVILMVKSGQFVMGEFSVR